MIEIDVLNYLNENLTSCRAYLQKQTDEAPFVLIERTSGGKRNQICTAQFAIQSYGPSMYDAARINEEVKSVMESIVSLPNISSSKLNSDYNFTDTSKKHYRYQAIFDLVYMEA